MLLSYQLWNKTGISSLKTTPKIILLHGMGGTGSLWRPLAASLEEKIAVLAPDQRGHGKSLIPTAPGTRQKTNYTPLEYGQDVIDTIENLDFHPTWILGHSMGVRTAVAAAHLKPEWVQGLVLIDLGFSGEPGGGLGGTLKEFIKTMPVQFSTRPEARNYMDQHCPDPAIGQYLMAVSTKTVDGQLTFPFDKGALIQTIEAAQTVSVRAWVQELAVRKIPILVFRGARSLVWSHEDFEKEKNLFTEFPHVQFEEIPDAGHGLPFEQRALLTRRLEQMILIH